jgi:hypothetical protein
MMDTMPLIRGCTVPCDAVSADVHKCLAVKRHAQQKRTCSFEQSTAAMSCLLHWNEHETQHQ